MASQVFMIMSNGAKLQGRGGVSSGTVVDHVNSPPTTNGCN